MRLSTMCVFAALLLGCSPKGAVDAPSVTEVPSTEETASATSDPLGETEERGADGGDVRSEATARQLYESCRDRVELPEAASECLANEECRAVGCGGEVCVSVAVAADLNTTCEVRPCFAVLDRCECVAGACQWTLKDDVPAFGHPISLPASSPTTE